MKKRSVALQCFYSTITSSMSKTEQLRAIEKRLQLTSTSHDTEVNMINKVICVQDIECLQEMHRDILISLSCNVLGITAANSKKVIDGRLALLCRMAFVEIKNKEAAGTKVNEYVKAYNILKHFEIEGKQIVA